LTFAETQKKLDRKNESYYNC